MIIIDEVKFIEDQIDRNEFPKNMSIKRWLKYLVKYYYDHCKDMTVKKYADTVLEVMDRFDLPKKIYQKYDYAKWVQSQCSNARKGKLQVELRNPKEVIITKSEMERIESAETEQQRKFLFTLYVLAKVQIKQTGWVNYPVPELFKLANIGVPADQRAYFLGNIDRQGLLDFDRTARTYGNKVELIDGEPGVVVTRFEDLGKQYVLFTKPEWFMCQNCGKLIKKNSNMGRPLKYCKECADKIHNRQKKESVYKSRDLYNIC